MVEKETDPYSISPEVIRLCNSICEEATPMNFTKLRDYLEPPSYHRALNRVRKANKNLSKERGKAAEALLGDPPPSLLSRISNKAGALVSLVIPRH